MRDCIVCLALSAFCTRAVYRFPSGHTPPAGYLWDDCSYNADKGEYEFLCGTGQKILCSLVCDYRDKCLDKSDESNCPQCGQNDYGYICESSPLCISEGWVCDGIADCPQHSDEDVSFCEAYVVELPTAAPTLVEMTTVVPTVTAASSVWPLPTTTPVSNNQITTTVPMASSTLTPTESSTVLHTTGSRAPNVSTTDNSANAKKKKKKKGSLRTVDTVMFAVIAVVCLSIACAIGLIVCVTFNPKIFSSKKQKEEDFERKTETMPVLSPELKDDADTDEGVRFRGASDYRRSEVFYNIEDSSQRQEKHTRGRVAIRRRAFDAHTTDRFLTVPMPLRPPSFGSFEQHSCDLSTPKPISQSESTEKKQQSTVSSAEPMRYWIEDSLSPPSGLLSYDQMQRRAALRVPVTVGRRPVLHGTGGAVSVHRRTVLGVDVRESTDKAQGVFQLKNDRDNDILEDEWESVQRDGKLLW